MKHLPFFALSIVALSWILPSPRTDAAEDIAAAVKAAGGVIEFSADDPTVVVAIDLYNGANPLKGKGGKNDVVTDAWLKHLAGLTSIKRLNLANCAITDAGMKQVGELTSLEELNLTLTAITDEGLSHLGKLTRLRSLGLASSQCSGAGFIHLKDLKQLESVNFHYTPFNDEGLKAVCAVGVSGRLWFAHTHFTDAAAPHLSQLKQLRRCGIGSKHEESSGTAVAALSELPLEDLSLLDRQATDEGVQHAAKIKTLIKLDVSYAPKLTNEVLPPLAALPHLESLTLGGSSEITDAGLLALAKSTSLQQLRLLRLKQVTPEGVEKLKALRPELKIEVQ